MAVGLRIFNDDGISQISDQHRGFALIGKGTVQSQNANSDPRYDIQYGMHIEVTSPDPVFFAASAFGGATAHLTEIVGNIYKGFVLFGIHGAPVTWYAFSYPKNIQTNLGLQVFNAQGKLMYDAAQKPLRISHVSVINTPGLRPHPTPWTSSDAAFAPSTPPPDIFISQARKNRTYASMGISLLAWRRLEKVYFNGSTLFGHGLFYYMPVNDPNGIRLKARWSHMAPMGTLFPPGTVTNACHHTYADNKQVSWIIDVTGY